MEIKAASELGCSFSEIPCTANQIIGELDKEGAKRTIFFFISNLSQQPPLLETSIPLECPIFLFGVP